MRGEEGKKREGGRGKVGVQGTVRIGDKHEEEDNEEPIHGHQGIKVPQSAALAALSTLLYRRGATGSWEGGVRVRHVNAVEDVYGLELEEIF